MAVAYATPAELADYLPSDVIVDDAERLLARATELIDDKVRAPFSIDDTGAATDTDVAAALRAACCAQVEFWLEVGEEHDVTGLAGRQVGIGQLSLEALPPELAPRAARILAGAGLLTMTTTLLGWV